MIEVRKLVKRFEDKTVLNGIDLDIGSNETLVILGPSGQGKTVLIKAMVRLLSADSGSVCFDGVDIYSMKKKHLFELQKEIAFVFQNSALFDFLDIRENLSLYLKMHTKLGQDTILDRVRESLRFVGLDDDVLDKFPEEISGGMRKRAAIARAMIKKPKYIFYDEPTNGLDKGNAEKVAGLIGMLKSEMAATSVIVTHDIKLMQDVSDRVVLLKSGKVDFDGTRENISTGALEELYQQEQG